MAVKEQSQPLVWVMGLKASLDNVTRHIISTSKTMAWPLKHPACSQHGCSQCEFPRFSLEGPDVRQMGDVHQTFGTFCT